MRIYVSVDLEGIHQIDRFDTHDDKNPDYQKWKRKAGELMYEEIHALYKGLSIKGLSDMVVFDSHSRGNTFHCSKNIPNLTQVSRCGDNNGFFPSLNSSFDGIILWGYHVMAGSKEGKLAHTDSRRIEKIEINEKEVGEVYLHALYAYEFGVPLIAVSGDIGLENEVKKDIGNVPFFNADLGNIMLRKKYLEAISDFILNLKFVDVLQLNTMLNCPLSKAMKVTYKNPLVNIARWLIKKQFQHARLNSFSSCIYEKESFSEQWNQYCGLTF